MTRNSVGTSFELDRRTLLTGAAAAGAAVAVGITAASAAPGSAPARSMRMQDDEPTIIIGTLGEAQTINPFLSADESESDFRCKMLYDQFVHINPGTYAPEPGIAASWTIDNLTFTFKIQPNATFADGSDLTADDVAFTYEQYLDPANASPRSGKFMVVKGAQEYADGTADSISGITVVDPKTISIELTEPNAAFLFNQSLIFVVPKALVGDQTGPDASFYDAPVGAGPYKFVSWAVGSDFVAEANEHYWQEGKPAIKSFTHRVIADANSLVLALESGDIDGSNYPAPTARDQLQANDNLQVIIPPFASPNGWMFNTTVPALSTAEARLAIAMALDTATFAADSLLGMGAPGNGPIAPDSWAFYKDLTPIPYDVEKAKELLATAGVEEGTKIRFNVNQGNVLREDWLTFTQQALKEIGIDVQPDLLEYATLSDQVVNQGDYEVTGVDFCGVTAEPSELYDQFHSDSPGNYSKISDPELDDLLEQARRELDLDAAKEIYEKIQVRMLEVVPMFFAWYRPFLNVVRVGYEGFTPSAEYTLFQTLEDWTYTAP
ncbi:MAG TPA: ABC transporter substrate-binding protein [Thermomicrobiales bacterium]|nr:ABC transporter substrate-binding protein [Thermomicrobiales bacterium]